MKNLVVLFAAFFSFVLISCSDVSDNSLLTNPVMEKSNLGHGSDVVTTLGFPYSYLFNFTSVEQFKYAGIEDKNAIEFYVPKSSENYFHLYVVITYFDGVSQAVFVDQFKGNTFILENIKPNLVSDVKVYGYQINVVSREIVSPFNNQTVLNQIKVNGWGSNENSIKIESEGTFSRTNNKSVFAEIITNDQSFFVYLQNPSSNCFIIPEYGKYDVKDIKLFGYKVVALPVD